MIILVQQIVGIILTLALAVLLLAWAKMLYEDSKEKYRDKFYNTAMNDAKIELGRKLVTESWYLTQYPDAQKVIHLIGDDLCHFGNYDINSIRERMKTNESI